MRHGAVAGRYALEREIGRGGMGVVWLAHDEILGRQVALKRIGLLLGGASPDLERAEREAKLAASLNHPHVVAVFDLVTEGDSQWLVMEYVESTTLAELARRQGGLAPDLAARILQQAAEALAAAHEAGIVHRDVKPSNILVAPDGTAKLTDFGIARAQADSTLTQTGLVTGSPAYLAPEVASGQRATAASDVWSLGATLFHALSGRPPYDGGENVMSTLYQIVHEDPPRLPDAGWLAPVLDSTMARDADQRWSMAQVRDFLSRAGAAEPSRPPAPPSTPPPTPPPAMPIAPDPTAPSRNRRRQASWVVAAAAVALVVVGLAWLLGRGDDGEPGSAGPTSGRQTGEAAPTETPRPETAAPADAEDMADFVSTYVATAAEDPRAGFAMLTPGYQAESGGLSGYRGFWGDITSAKASKISADPDSMKVSYDVRYKKGRGTGFDDYVELILEYDGSRYLIAGEPTR